jgi:virulence factor Mce-like protein
LRRVLAIGAALVAAAVVVVLGTGAGDKKDDGTYWVELDNAFGLIKGADLKVAGVRAGKITGLKLDERTHRALVGFKIDRAGFGSLRSDVRCDSRPQSLIGEYFLDCDPGTARQALRPGATIPVSQTSSTIAPDLIGDIMRRPYRERFSIILGELGAAVGGNASSLNAAVRRASPALRETDRVLAKLASQNQVLKNLVTNADRVLADLSGNRKDVARWVVEARDTAQASAERRSAISAGWRKLPGFLEELKPTMASLGEVARNQAPALRNLDASSKNLETFFGELGPFADASRPAFKALGKASDTGQKAMKAATGTIALLSRFSGGVPELGRNLAITLEHLDDRRWAVEKDPRSPGGKGYTGLEALLTYVYDQALSTNVFDSNVHYLKVSVAEGPCANYADIERVKKTKGLEEQCGSRPGPKAPGLNYRDPTAGPEGRDQARKVQHKTDRTSENRPPEDQQQPGQDALPDVPGGDTPAVPEPKAPQPAAPAPSKPNLPPVTVPSVPPVSVGGRQDDTPQTRESQSKLLDYLLGP